MSDNEISNLPVPCNNNPLDGTEFNNKYIYRTNNFLNAKQSIIEGENPLYAKSREMTINEQRLFMLTLLKMRPNLTAGVDNDKPFQIEVIPTSTILKIFLGNKKYYETLRNAASALYNLSVDLSYESTGQQNEVTGEKNFHKKRIFDEMKFGPDYGGLYFRFAEAVRPYLYDLCGKPYTKIAGRLIFSLNSTYGIRLLELMLQYQNIKEFQQIGEIRRVFDVDEFRRIFGLDNNKSYKRMGNLKNRVIKYAINDINRNTKYRIEYADIKEGRSIKKFVFRMKSASSEKYNMIDNIPTVDMVLQDKFTPKYIEQMHIDENEERSKLSAHLMCYGIGQKESQRLVQEYDAERIKANIEYTLNQANIKNLAGYIRKAIEDNYVVSKSAKSENKLNEKHEIFMKKLRKFDLGPVCSSLILNKLENNGPFTSQEEDWLNDRYIDPVSLREAFITNTPDEVKPSFDMDEYIKEQEADLFTSEEANAFWKEYAEYQNDDDEADEGILKITDAEFDEQYANLHKEETKNDAEMTAEFLEEEKECDIKKTEDVKTEDIVDEADSLRGELGIAIACRESISRGKYTRAQELGLIPALEGLAGLCNINLMDLVR